jgi:methyl-accepting chemotaxis protein
MTIFDWNNVKLSNAQANEVAHRLDRFSEGDLSGTFRNGSVLTARLAPLINNLQDQLVRQRGDATALATALAEMTKAHAAGAIDAAIAADTLAEPYRAIASNINALVKSHIDVKMKIVDVVTRYADGDFSVAMDRLPGKKAAITEAIDKAKSTFEAVTAQAAASEKFVGALGEMTKQHDLGWIDEQIPAAEFTGSYKHAAELVNALVKSHIDVKMKIVEVITKYSNGDFSVPMDRLPGKKAQITDAIDRARLLMQTADLAVNDVVRVLGHSRRAI